MHVQIKVLLIVIHFVVSLAIPLVPVLVPFVIDVSTGKDADTDIVIKRGPPDTLS